MFSVTSTTSRETVLSFLSCSPNYRTTPQIRQSSVSFGFIASFEQKNIFQGCSDFFAPTSFQDSIWIYRQVPALMELNSRKRAPRWGLSFLLSMRDVCLLLTLGVTGHPFLKPVADIPLGKIMFPGNKSLSLWESVWCHSLPP